MNRARRVIYGMLIFILFSLLWFAWNYPDWIVAGPPKDFRFNPIASAEQAPVAQPAIPETPVTSKPELTSTEPVVILPTPLPEVQAVPMPADFKRSDGFENMCTTMPDGTFTTVIIKDYPTPTTDLWPYTGEIDPATEAPATAAGSQAWCRDHKPN